MKNASLTLNTGAEEWKAGFCPWLYSSAHLYIEDSCQECQGNCPTGEPQRPMLAKSSGPKMKFRVEY